MEYLESILKEFGLGGEAIIIQPIKQGLINETWKISANDSFYILQKVNDKVFKKPADIAYNISLIAAFLEKNDPDYFFVNALPDNKGNTLYSIAEGHFRIFPFVKGSHTVDTVNTTEQAFEAARQFGRFTKALQNFDAKNLRTTISSFHDLSLRYRQFLAALQNGNPDRVTESESLIRKMKKYSFIEKEYKSILQNPDFKIRVTHHDTKISNVLFDESEKGICVIDLDTVMPGFFFSDVGDMMRTYLSPVSEEETDINKIEVRVDYYTAIVKGYLLEMQDELSEEEKQHFFFAGTFIIYMQALRFLTDHLLEDAYYGASYPGHNLNRAKNQVVLLERLFEKKQMLVDLHG